MLCHLPEGATAEELKASVDRFYDEDKRDEAKSLCFHCEAQAECLRDGLREPFGIWGGLGETERRNLAALLDAKGLEL